MNLFAKLPPLPTPEQMSQWDRLAMDFGIPEIMLMENAAAAVTSALKELDLLHKDRPVWLFMGGGNNGGDAAAISRRLLEEGLEALVLRSVPFAHLKGAAREHALLAKNDGVRFLELQAQEDSATYLSQLLSLAAGNPKNRPALILDGLLGTGFRGTLRPAMQALIAAVNQLASCLRCQVCAIDAPSGLDCGSGRPSPTAIRANVTITLAAAKSGLLLPEAAQWTGQVYRRKIGMPASPAYPVDYYLLDGRLLLKQKNFVANSYKNSYGHVYVAGGSSGLEGAPHLACLSALRSGAGLVTACAPGASLSKIKARQPEIMTLAICDGDRWPELLAKNIQEALQKASALVIGPGMGRDEAAARFLRAVLEMPDRPPAVFDADSLVLMGENPELLARITSRDIFTPHPGEAGALLHCPAREIQADREAALKKLTNLAPAVMVLKGAATRIGQRNRPSLLCPYDIPQMAVGGAGDVLAGCAGAFLAKAPMFGEDSLYAAARAVITHVLAGMICARRYPARGALAGDLLEAIPQAQDFLRAERANNPLERLPWPAFTSEI